MPNRSLNRSYVSLRIAMAADIAVRMLLKLTSSLRAASASNMNGTPISCVTLLSWIACAKRTFEKANGCGSLLLCVVVLVLVFVLVLWFFFVWLLGFLL